MTAYYNEIDPYAAQWLRNLIDAGHIAPGIVDERSIEDVYPSDLRGFTQCHFFAGIGVWSHALRLAGWSDDRPVWTGSCPCQPFSAAGKGAGTSDERHLWPAWHHLIRECRPVVVVGEQVASRAALGWWDAVHADLEDEGYACAALDLAAAGAGAPHIRQRLLWVALAQHSGREAGQQTRRGAGTALPSGTACGLADGALVGWREERADTGGRIAGDRSEGLASRSGAGRSPCWGFWDSPDWVLCRDPKGASWRPVEPGTFPLAHGTAARVGRLRAYGNAIVAPLAAEFVRAIA